MSVSAQSRTKMMSARSKLKEIVCDTSVAKHMRQRRLQGIADNLKLTSRNLTRPDFTRIHPTDLRLLYELYDEHFFEGKMQKCLSPLDISFRLSGRMTRAGGKTTTFRQPMARSRSIYEIAVSTTLLFGSFRDPEHPVTVTGLECEHRLDGLMRIMEHELIHLIEMVVWDDSSCSKRRFQSIASGFFGHTEHTHALTTPKEAAAREFGIRPGMRVRFDIDGSEHEGVVNRITKRATVLVPHPDGEPFSDGQRYIRYYVPIRWLERVE